MSKYVFYQDVVLRDQSCLMQALVDLGVPKEQIEVNPQGAYLYGYHGDRRETQAHIIVRRSVVNRYLSGGSSNDLGFERLADGTYRPIISDYDGQAMRPTVNGKKLGSGSFLPEFKRAYNTRLIPKIGRALGLQMKAPIQQGSVVKIVGVK